MSTDGVLRDAEQAITNLQVPDDCPTWIQGLMGIFVALVGELKKLNEKVNKMVELESLVSVQQKTTETLRDDNVKLRAKVENLNLRVSHMEVLVDNNEQHDRNINLLLHGVPEEDNENSANVFVEAIKPYIKDIKHSDVERVHRLGPFRKNTSRPRPIICRFNNELRKMDIYKKKSYLKGTKLLLTENLTKWRQTVYNTARNVLGVKHVWTIQGRIFTRHNEQKLEIASEHDIPGFVQNTDSKK